MDGHPEAAADAILLHGLDGIFRAGWNVAAADAAFEQRMADGAIEQHAAHVEACGDLVGRRAAGVEGGQRKNDRPRDEISLRALQAFPQCGHLALACRRMLLQL